MWQTVSLGEPTIAHGAWAARFITNPQYTLPSVYDTSAITVWMLVSRAGLDSDGHMTAKIPTHKHKEAK